MVVANFDPPGAANGCPPLKEGDAKPGVDTDRSFGPWDSCSRADLEIRVVTAVSGECLAADYGRTARNLSEQSSAPLKASSPEHRLRRISALTPSPMAEFRAPLSNLQPLSRLPKIARDFLGTYAANVRVEGRPLVQRCPRWVRFCPRPGLSPTRPTRFQEPWLGRAKVP
jgi:hypothetical protein